MTRLASRERYSFGQLREVLALPDLIAVQRESFQWFLEQGIAEVLRDISPIEDFTGQLKLELSDHVFDPPKHSEDECRERDMTFAASAVRDRALHERGHGRDQGADRLHG